MALTSGPNTFKVTATGTNNQQLTANLTIIRDNAPTVAQAISNFSVATNAGPSTFNLPTVFSDQDVNTLVEFTTNRGTFDVELFNQQVGTTVANFLKYVTRDRRGPPELQQHDLPPGDEHVDRRHRRPPGRRLSPRTNSRAGRR